MSTLPPLDDPRRIFDLTGRVGLITGGAGKMGVEFARVLARSGAELVLADRDAKVVEDAAARVGKETGRSVEGVACDVADLASVRALFERVRARHPRLHFLVHNVMAKPQGYYQTSATYDPETWRKIFDANTMGAFLVAREAAALMPEGGAVVLTASIYALAGPDPRIYQGAAGANPYAKDAPLGVPAAYSASKGAIVSLARHLAAEWGPRGIRVNTLVPGGVRDGQAPAFIEAYSARTPMGRMGEWTDYNGAILFLVSDASRYMTGASLVVDGGWTAW